MLAVVTEDGALAMLDVCQAQDRQPAPHRRMALLRELLESPQPLYQATGAQTGNAAVAQTGDVSIPAAWVSLAPPRSVGTSLLFPRAWALVLRLLLQLGVPQDVLLYLCSTQAVKGRDGGPRSAVASPSYVAGSGDGLFRQQQPGYPQDGDGDAEEEQEEGDARNELLGLLPLAVHKVVQTALQPRDSSLNTAAPAARQDLLHGGLGESLGASGHGATRTSFGNLGGGRLDGVPDEAPLIELAEPAPVATTGSVTIMQAVSMMTDAFRMVGMAVPGLDAAAPRVPEGDAAGGNAAGGGERASGGLQSRASIGHAAGGGLGAISVGRLGAGAKGGTMGSGYRGDLLGLIRHLAKCASRLLVTHFAFLTACRAVVLAISLLCTAHARLCGEATHVIVRTAASTSACCRLWTT